MSGEAGEEARPAWIRVLIPSVGDLLFIVLLAMLVFTPLSVRLLGDAGIGWHIRTGQQILATGAIPRADSFSSTMSGKPWFAWEWLYDLVVGGLERWAGLNGVVVFTALMVAGVFAGLFRLAVRHGTGVFVALALVLLAASASMIHFFARPHVMSWVFTLMWFWILDATERRTSPPTRLWLLPLLILVWVNVHGGFLVGFVLLAIYWVGAVWEWISLGDQGLDELLSKLRAGKRARDLAWVGLLSAVASFANPYGWKLHAHIWRYLSDRFLMDHIDEFQSPNFHGVAQKCFAGLLLITIVALAARGRSVRLSEGLVVVFAVYAGLYGARNIPVSSLLLVMVAGPLLSEALAGLKGRAWARVAAFSERMGAMESSLRGHGWALIAAIAICAIAANGGRFGATQAIDAHFDGKRFPVAAVDFLEKNGVAGPVLSPDYWGGYLIYRMHPGTLVVVDDRHDMYGAEFFKTYLRMIHLEPGWEGFLREHDFGYLLLPKGSALANVLVESRGWKTIYADDVAIALERGAAAR